MIAGNILYSNGSTLASGGYAKGVVINSTIAGNNSSPFITGGAGSVEFINSVVWGNNGSLQGTAHTYRNSLIQGLTSTENGNIADTDPKFKAPLHFDNAPFITGDYGLENCSPLTNASTTDTTGLYLPVKDLAGNTRIAFDRVDIGAFENSHNPASSIASSKSVVVNMQKTDGQIQYYNSCNELVATVAGTNDASSVSGGTVAKVWIETSQSSAYVKRHYEITPSNPEGSGVVTLYFTNQEFKDFNALNPATLLPDADEPATIDNRIPQIILEKLAGTSNNGTGLPGSYTGGTVNITPSAVIWNNAQRRWEVTFPTTGFSGFYLKTNAAPLPVSWISFSSSFNTENQAVLKWKVNEIQVLGYQVQRSKDAIHFEPVGTLDGKGNGINNYQFTDISPLKSNTYYRIKQTDLDGSTSYSRIISVAAKSLFSFYPNPVTDFVSITVDEDQLGTKVNVISLDGKILKQEVVTKQSFSIDVSDLQKGIYLIQTQNGHTAKLVKY